MKLIAFILFLSPLQVFAQAQVFPTRLTLTEETPSSYITLRNPGAKAQKFKVELMQLQMKKDGSVAKTTDDKNPLVELIKYSPKSIEIPPNDKQVVRVMMTSFDSLPEGENYIYLHVVPESETAPKPGQKFSLQARIAVAVPIIVRHGIPKLDAKMLQPKVTRDAQGNMQVRFELTNNTKFFLTGDLEIAAVTAKGDVVLENIKSLSSYIPNRMVTLDLPKSSLEAKLTEENLSKVKIHYASNSDSAAAFDLNAETTVERAPVTANKNSAKKSSKRR